MLMKNSVLDLCITVNPTAHVKGRESSPCLVCACFLACTLVTLMSGLPCDFKYLVATLCDHQKFFHSVTYMTCMYNDRNKVTNEKLYCSNLEIRLYVFYGVFFCMFIVLLLT